MPYYIAANALLASKDELARAERYFRKYLLQESEAESPSHAAARWRLGLVLEHQGRKAEAITEIEAALKADASIEPAKKDLKRLKGS